MSMPVWRRLLLTALFASVGLSSGASGANGLAASIGEQEPTSTRGSVRAVLDDYCVRCHNDRLRTADLSLDADSLNVEAPGTDGNAWERVVAKLRAGSMPPPGLPRPDRATYIQIAKWLEDRLDASWAANPNPGRTASVHRLNRTEYQNAIRDLLAVHVDVSALLPGDETADGSFDNFADALTISKAHLERHLSVARQVTRLAVGLPPTTPRFETIEIPLHIVQNDRRSDDLPFGSRGGTAVTHQFPVDGEYVIRVRLRRQYQDYLVGMGWQQQLDLRLDGRLLERFMVGGDAPGRPAGASYAGGGEPGFAGDPRWEKYMQLTGDAGLEVRVPIDAGPHVVGVSFVRELWEPEELPQPLQRGRVITNDQVYMGYAAVASIEIGGPFLVTGTSATPSRKTIFTCEPAHLTDERVCASDILSRLARLAYRRPVTDDDVASLLAFFESGRETGGSFESGIQFSLERMLVDPDFLLRVYRDPSTPTRGQRVYRLRDIEVASRLSFFLWSSIPDDRLLKLAESSTLTTEHVLEDEVRRMLADPRAADSLVGNFAAQWLNLRRVADAVVDQARYPHYDENLLEAFKRETELFVASTLREDRSVTDLLSANYTFVNERLARHYGIPGIYGTRFRRVALTDPDQRGGLLSHGSVLVTTSYPDRTSPVLRGKWLLDNIFGVRVPPPPAGVDTALEENSKVRPASIRERLARHRQNPACSSCHSMIDPIGFALENFDVVGGWRTEDEGGNPIDARSTTAAGEVVEGLSGLRALLLENDERFPRTVTEKLAAYALGRTLEPHDQPMVRRVVRNAADENYRWSALVLGIVKSPTFLMRTREVPAD